MPATPPTSARPELLDSFLAENQAECPVCGYNLHAVTSGTCPECGHQPTLALAQPDVLGRRRGLLLLIFAWLLLAGGMNGYSSVLDVHRSLTTPPSQQVFVLGRPAVLPDPRPIDVNIESILTTVERSVSDDRERDVDPQPADAETAAPTIHQAMTFRFGDGQSPAPSLAQLPALTIDTYGRFAPSIAQPGRGLAWSTVGWQAWAGAAWWICLAVAATVALITIYRYRRREASRRLGRILLTTAWLGFTGYFAFHVVRFAESLS